MILLCFLSRARGGRLSDGASLRDTCASSESQFDSRRTGRARRPQHAVRRAARGLETTPHRAQERVAGEGAVDADASVCTAEERVERNRLVCPE